MNITVSDLATIYKVLHIIQHKHRKNLFNIFIIPLKFQTQHFCFSLRSTIALIRQHIIMCLAFKSRVFLSDLPLGWSESKKFRFLETSLRMQKKKPALEFLNYCEVMLSAINNRVNIN
jgi:hypothetical protein